MDNAISTIVTAFPFGLAIGILVIAGYKLFAGHMASRKWTLVTSGLAFLALILIDTFMFLTNNPLVVGLGLEKTLLQDLALGLGFTSVMIIASKSNN